MKFIFTLIATFYLLPTSGQNLNQISPSSISTCNSPKSYSVKWKTTPFDLKIFIENNGQFDAEVENKNKVLFGADLGEIKAYFTTAGITYRYDEYKKSMSDKEKSEEERERIDIKTRAKRITHYTGFTWEGANSNVKIEASEKRSDYYIYPIGASSSVQVNLYKKIIYKDLYPGIDVEYIFPGGEEGLKYSIIVHPGADPSQVKLKYFGINSLDKNRAGDLIIKTPLGDFIDHAPITFYQGETKNIINSINQHIGDVESFKLPDGYDTAKTLVIDPWITNPFGYGNKIGPWDIDYDYAGNVYAASQQGLIKLNSSGAILWTYILTNTFNTYGEISANRLTGDVFIAGDNYSGTPELGIVQKVSTNGTLIGSISVGAKAGVQREFWRAAFNQCTQQLIVGAGGLSDIYQAAKVNINLTQLNLVNVLNVPANSPGGFDIAGVAIDPSGTSCFMISGSNNPTNTLLKVPCPPLAPTTFNQPNGYLFGELYHNYYAGTGITIYNGMNIIATGTSGVYVWDGYTLKQFNKTTGALIQSNQILPPPPGTIQTHWAGIDVDACETIYVGYKTTIKAFNSSLTQINSIPMPNNLDTLNDVAVGNKGKIIYACGTGFVTAIDVSGPPTDSIVKMRTQATCSCTGTASATFTQCGNTVTTGVTYLWDNGQTSQTATGLCAGVHNVTLNYNCRDYPDTVLISSPTNIVVNSSQTNVSCNAGNNGTATISVSGGLAPYTYNWSGGAGTNSNANNLIAGNYTVTVTDANGCKAIKIVSISQPAALIANLTTTNNSCTSTGSATFYVGNNTPYSYTWSTGQTGTYIGGLVAGTYTLTITSSNGCSQTKTFGISGTNPTLATFTQTPNNLCMGNTVYFTNTGSSGTHSWTIKEIYGVTGTTANWSYAFLYAGTFSITHTVTNAGCTGTVTSTVTVVNCSAPTATTTGSSACPGACATLTSSGSGGTSPYTYSWSNGGATQNISPCPASTTTYTVTIKDTGGNTSTSTAVLTINPAVTVSITPSQINCSGASTGSATAAGGNGTPGYSYNWSASGGSGSTVSGLTVGNYTVTVTDSKGCTSTSTTTIISPSPLIGQFAKGTASCIGCGCKEWIMVNAAGGTSPYSYSWSASGGYINRYQNKLCPGNYLINIKDANGCSVNVNISAP